MPINHNHSTTNFSEAIPAKPNLTNQIYKAKHTKPNLLNITYQTKPTIPNLLEFSKPPTKVLESKLNKDTINKRANRSLSQTLMPEFSHNLNVGC